MAVKQEEGKCRCGGKGIELHPCPFKDEIHGDTETLCNCCDDCTQECWLER
jgi:hypothetical protein